MLNATLDAKNDLGLADNTAYNISVSASNSRGEGPISAATSFTTNGPPAKPTLSSAEATKVTGQVKLTWTTPANNGGEITAVEIIQNGTTVETLSADRSPNDWQDGTKKTPGATCTYFVTDLNDGTSYSFQVRAVNAYGQGTLSDAKSAAPYRIPDAPGGLKVTRGVQSLTLNWSAAANGGNAVSKYNVYETNSAGTPLNNDPIAKPSGTSHTITGLADNSTHYYVVSATNNAGEGAKSAVASGTTFALPQAPGELTVTPTGATTAKVSWPALTTEQAGGTPVTSYTIAWEPVSNGNSGVAAVAGSRTVNVGSSDLTSESGGWVSAIATGSGLVKGATYHFTVTATNAAGKGAASAAADARLFDQPNAPDGVEAKEAKADGKPVSGAVTVKWNAPTDSIGSSVNEYIIYVYNATGVGSDSEIGTQLKTVSVKPGENGFTNDGTGKIFANVTGLTNGTTYYFRVAAKNGTGTGDQSENQKVWAAPVYYPGPVPNVAASLNDIGDDHSFKVTWGNASDNGKPILGYQVKVYDYYGQLMTDGNPALTGSTETYTLENGKTITIRYTDALGLKGNTAIVSGTALNPFTTYSVGVVARNDLGADLTNISKSGSITTMDVPSEPGNVEGSSTGASGRVAIHWTEPVKRGETPITAYTIEIYEGAEATGTAVQTITKTIAELKGKYGETDFTKWLVEGLTDGRAYCVRVQAENKIGKGAFSAVSEIKSYRAPEAVRDVTATVKSGTAIDLAWFDPANDPGTGALGNGGNVITEYQISVYSVNEDGARTDVTASVTTQGTTAVDGKLVLPRTAGDIDALQSLSLTGLTMGATYVADIRAVNEAGASAAKGENAPATTWRLPGNAMEVSATPTNVTGEVSLTWKAPQDDGNAAGATDNRTEISGYQAYFRNKDQDSNFSKITASATDTDGVYSLLVTGLTDGVEYEFYVAPENGAGELPAADATKAAATPRSPAPAPAIGEVRTGNASAVLTRITKPAQTGGSEIETYNIYAQEIKSGAAGEPVLKRSVSAIADELTDITIPTLENGKQYAISVRAINGTGIEGTPSAVQNVTVGLPFAPTEVTASPGPRFTAVADFKEAEGNGSPIQYYLAYVNDSNTPYAENGETVKFAQKPVTVTADTGGASFTIRVSAVNRVGESPKSEPVTITIGAPTAPRLTAAGMTSNGVTLTWEPANGNGISMKQYNVEMRSKTQGSEAWSDWATIQTTAADKTGTVLAREAADPYPGLANGTLYEVRVVAENLVGQGPASNVKDFRFGVPQPPTVLGTEFADGSLTVRFTAPADTGVGEDGVLQGTIESYTIYANGIEKRKLDPKAVQDGSDFWLADGVYYARIDGLANGSAYNIQMTASNHWGESALSGGQSGTPATISEAPRGIVAEATSDTAVHLTWKAPLNDGGSTISDYSIRIYEVTESAEGEPVANLVSGDVRKSGLTADISGLARGKSYRFEVAAMTAAGEGAAGKSGVVTTFTKPGEPTITYTRSYYNTGNAAYNLEVRWDAPKDTGGTPITGYKVWIGRSLKSGGLLPADTTSFTVTGIKAGNYNLRVEAFNKICDVTDNTAYGKGTSAFKYTAVGKIAAPVISEVSATDKTITLRWDPVVDEFAYYNIYDLSDIMNNPANGASTIEQALDYVNGHLLTAGAARVDALDADGNANSEYTFDNPDSGAHYYVMCCFTNQAINGEMSNMVEVTLGGPSAPEVIAAEAGFESVRLTFNKPSKLNKNPLYGYQFYLDGKPFTGDVTDTDGALLTQANGVVVDTAFVDSPDPATAILKGIPGGQKYSVSLRAVTNDLEGERYLPGIMSQAKECTVWTTPTAPMVVDTTSGDGRFTITFRDADGKGLPIAGYAVFHEQKGESWLTEPFKTVSMAELGESREIAVDGITNGYKDESAKGGYAYYVASYTESGGERWYSATPATPQTIVTGIPGAPTITKATAGNQSITLAYEAPAMDPSIAVTKYHIYYQAAGGERQSASTDKTTCTIEKLDNTKTYSITVQAVNGVGEGAESEPVVLTPGTPAAPEILDYASGDRTLMVRWRAPGNNGSSLTSYRVYYTDTRDGSRYYKNVDVNLTTLTLTELDNGAAYAIEVTAFNGNGEGRPSEKLTLMPGTIPGAPEEVTAAVAGANKVTLSWLAPASDGGVAIDYYEVKGDGAVENVNAEGFVAADDEHNYELVTDDAGNERRKYTVTVGELAPGKTYRFEIRAHNQRDFGPAAVSGEATTFTMPDKPEWRSIESVNLTFSIGWTAPANDGGTPVTGYNVYVNGEKVQDNPLTTAPDGGLSLEPDGSITYAAPNPLPNGTELILGETYKVCITAVNEAGESPRTSEMNIRIQAAAQDSVPGRPGTPVVERGNSQITVAWAAPSIEGTVEGIEGYYIHYRVKGQEETAEPIWHAKSDLVTTITGLTNDTTYEVWVVARNRLGLSAASTIVEGTPAEIDTPSAPTDIKYQNNAQMTTMTVSWTEAVASTAGGTVYYDLYINNTDERPNHTTTNTQFQMSVVTGVKYKIWVVARNQGGSSPRDPEKPDIIAQNWLNVETTGTIGAEPNLNLDRDMDGELDADQMKTKPTAPGGLKATISVGLTAINLSWETPVKEVPGQEPEPFTDVEQYKVYLDGALYETIDALDGEGNEVLSAVVTDKADGIAAGLTPGKIYSLQVSAVNEKGESEASLPLQIYVQKSSNPTDLTATPGTGKDRYTSVKLEWQKPTADESPFQYQIQVNGLPLGVPIGGDLTSYALDTLKPNNNYVFRVSAIYKDEATGALTESPTSNAVQLSTALIAPDAPTELAAETTDLDGNIITLTWNESLSSETSYYKLYVNGAEFAEQIPAGAPYLYHAQPGSDYTFTLTAVNEVSYAGTGGVQSVAVKESAKSNVAVASTRTIQDTAPAAPQNLNAVLDGRDITLTWDEVTQTINGEPLALDPTQELTYAIYASVDGDELHDIVELVNGSYEGDIQKNGSQVSYVYHETDGSTGHQYVFRVAAVLRTTEPAVVNEILESPLSPEPTETPPVQDPAAPETGNKEPGEVGSETGTGSTEGGETQKPDAAPADPSTGTENTTGTENAGQTGTVPPAPESGSQTEETQPNTGTGDAETVITEPQTPLAASVDGRAVTEITGAMSDPVTISTKIYLPLPSVPMNLTTSISADRTTITLRWDANDVTEQVEKYLIYLDSTQTDSVNAPTTEYIYTVPEGKESFYFQIAAQNQSEDANSVGGALGVSELSEGVSVALSGQIELPKPPAAPSITASVHSAPNKAIRVYWTAPALDSEGNALPAAEITGYKIMMAELDNSGNTVGSTVLSDKFNTPGNYDEAAKQWYYDIDIESTGLKDGTKYAITIAAWRSFTIDGVSNDILGAIQKPWLVMQNLNLDENGDWTVDKYPDADGDGAEDTAPGTLVTLRALVEAGGKADLNPDVTIEDQTGETISSEKVVYDPATGRLTVEFRILAAQTPGTQGIALMAADGMTDTSAYSIKISKKGCTYFKLTDIPMSVEVSTIDLETMFGKIDLKAGDVNGDGIVNSQDIMALYGYYGTTNADELMFADSNGDGIVNSQDVMQAYNGFGNSQIIRFDAVSGS